MPSFDGCDDGFGFFDPTEWPWVGVVFDEEPFDGGLQVDDGVEDAALPQVALRVAGAVGEGKGGVRRIPNAGIEIGDDVEIGAVSTVDAGTIRATKIGTGTKIDNLVQVGHNVIVGMHCLLCAQTAVAGSAVIGDRCVLGGKSGIADNLKIGADSVIGGAAIVLSDVPAGSFMMGYPAQPMMTYRARERSLRQAILRHKPVSNTNQND